MSEFAKMDFFFLITTLVVIVIGVLLAFVLYRIWKILGHVENISRDVSAESTLVRNDIAELRSAVHEGLNMLALGGIVSKAFKRLSGRSGKRGRSRDSTV